MVSTQVVILQAIKTLANDELNKMARLSEFSESLIKYAKTQNETRRLEYAQRALQTVAEVTTLFEKLTKSPELVQQVNRIQGLNLITWASCIATTAAAFEKDDPQKAKVRRQPLTLPFGKNHKK